MIGVFVVLLILLGVFVPTFSRQIVDGNLILAVFIILVVGFVQYVVWTRPRDPAISARRQARQEVRLARIQAKDAPPAKAEPPPAPPAEKTDNVEGSADKRDEGGSSDA